MGVQRHLSRRGNALRENKLSSHCDLCQFLLEPAENLQVTNFFPIENTDLSRLNCVDWKDGFLGGLEVEGEDIMIYFLTLSWQGKTFSEELYQKNVKRDEIMGGK